ncbi:MAG: ferredoxin [Armatimonadota bacterium]|nr:ferredoxin [Armatimonadota bacterium]
MTQANKGNGKIPLPVRNPLNAPGPFYVEGGLCLHCCLPEAEAPELIGVEYEGDYLTNGCFFKKQPETPEELDQAIDAMSVNCVATLRYGGEDLAILRRLNELGLRSQCDYPSPKE